MSWYVIAVKADKERVWSELVRKNGAPVVFERYSDAANFVEEIRFSEIGVVKYLIEDDFSLRRDFGIFDFYELDKRLVEVDWPDEVQSVNQNWILVLSANAIWQLDLERFEVDRFVKRVGRWNDVYDLWVFAGWKGRAKFAAMFLLNPVAVGLFGLEGLDWQEAFVYDRCAVLLDLEDCFKI